MMVVYSARQETKGRAVKTNLQVGECETGLIETWQGNDTTENQGIFELLQARKKK